MDVATLAVNDLGEPSAGHEKPPHGFSPDPCARGGVPAVQWWQVQIAAVLVAVDGANQRITVTLSAIATILPQQTHPRVMLENQV